MPYEPIFSQNGQLWIFGMNLAKLPNWMQYFGCNNVEGVAEAGMSWIDVDGAGWKWVEWSGGGCTV